MPNIRPISKALARKAQIELNEVPERMQERMDELKLWLLQQPQLRARLDDQFLVTFLRGSKWNIKDAKKKIHQHYKIRSQLPEIFLNRDPLDERSLQIIRSGYIVPLLQTEKADGPSIILIRPALSVECDPSKCSSEDTLKIHTMFSDILIRHDDQIIIGGQIGVLDMANTSKINADRFNPSLCKKMTVLSQEASPIRHRSFHYINTPPGFDKMLNVLKGFMSEKHQKKLYVHGTDLETFYKFVPQRFLPEEYGGRAGPIQNILDKWVQILIANRDFIRNIDRYGIDQCHGESSVSENDDDDDVIIID